ncbi:hypothetical protein GALL_331730 [mine drainage metagenome]|uniref:Uncharacterized protein n=1 Tax=mine drainage metagenome TaxID=410659 RepID=A0A1J5QZ26_9ZZZZ
MPRWTDETRARQAELIRIHRPWEKSTGPRTEEGKLKSCQNAYVHGAYSLDVKGRSARLRPLLGLIYAIRNRSRAKR